MRVVILRKDESGPNRNCCARADPIRFAYKDRYNGSDDDNTPKSSCDNASFLHV